MATARQPNFGDLLRRYRRAAGLTQEELAAQAGMSAHGIADLEAGRRRSPRRDTVVFLAEALGLGDHERAVFEAAARGSPIATSSPVLAAGQSSAGTPLAGVPLVGRAAEVARIEAHLAGNGPPLLVLAGEPGIGKSRLLREGALRAEARGWEVLAGGCHRRSGQEPFTPLLTALERHLARQSSTQQRQHLQGCGWLVRLLPELVEAGVLSPPSMSLPPEHERRLMFAAVGRYLANVAGPSGVLLLLDDLQWAATDALDLLAALLRTPPVVPLRIMAAYRDTEVRKHDPLAVQLADLTREELAAREALAPLSLPDAATLLDVLLPDGDAAIPGVMRTELKQQLIVRTAGVPYFLMSCAQAVTAGVLVGQDATSEAGVPFSVAETIRQRVGALTTEAQALLDVAAIVGRVVPRTLLLRVLADADRPIEVLVEALDAACAARLLVEEGEHGYHFAHDLVREVVATDLSAARRARLHRQVAEALEREPGEAPAEILAYHYAQGEAPECAVLYLERAGDRARERYAQAEAAGYYRQLVERLDAMGRATDAALAREKLGSVLMVTARFDEALATLEAAVAIYRDTGNADHLLALVALIGWIHSLRGTPGEGIAHLTPFVERMMPEQQSPRGVAAVYTSLAHLYYLSGEYGEQLGAAERAVACARAIQDAHILSQAAFEHGTALLFRGRFSEALEVLEDTIPLADEIGDLWTLCWLLSSASTIYHFRGQWGQDQRYIDWAIELAERLGDPPMMTLMTFRSATIAQARGDWEQAVECLHRCMLIQEATQPSWITPYPLWLLGEMQLAMGQRDEGLGRLEASIAICLQTGDLSPRRFAQAALAEDDLLAGRPEVARERLEPLLDRPGQVEGQVMSLLPILAWAYLNLSDEAQTEAIVEQATERSAAMGGYVAQIDVLRVRALLRIRRRQWADAAAALDESLRLARDMPCPYAEAKTLYAYGLFHVERGEADQAGERFQAALSILNRLGERLYAEHVERALRTL